MFRSEVTSLIWKLLSTELVIVSSVKHATNIPIMHLCQVTPRSLSLRLKALSGSSPRGSKARRPHATSPSWPTPSSPVLPTPGPPHQTPMDQSLTSDLQPLGSASFTGHSSQPRVCGPNPGPAPPTGSTAVRPTPQRPVEGGERRSVGGEVLLVVSCRQVWCYTRRIPPETRPTWLTVLLRDFPDAPECEMSLQGGDASR